MITRRLTWLATVCAVTALAAVVLAAAVIWLLVTDPLTVAQALNERDLLVLATAIARTLGRAVKLVALWL